MAHTPPSLKAQALAWLARREHSRAELRVKLLGHAKKLVRWQRGTGAAVPATDEFTRRRGRDDVADADVAAEVDAVLDWLAQQRHQSDPRFVEGRVHARAGRWGQARIRQELARHGVELDADTARQLRDTELERAREVWRRRFGVLATEASERARQMRFLAARGFAADVIRRIVGGRDDE